MMLDSQFDRLLTSTGFASSLGPSAGLLLPSMARSETGGFSRYAFVFDRSRFSLRVDGLFCTRNVPVLVFLDSTDREPTDPDLLEWHRLSWNFGLAPLLWIATPSRVVLVNNYASPSQRVRDVVIAEFDVSDDTGVRKVTAVCGRLAFDTGAFWKSSFARKIDRRERVDVVLLRELAALENKLRQEGLPPLLAQKLIGRVIFSQYLVDRGLLPPATLEVLFGRSTLPELLRDPASAGVLFSWMKATFNGDLFPPDVPGEAESVGRDHLGLLADFLQGLELSSGQWRMFPFRFDVIPVELISSIYEQFAHSIAGEDATAQGLHYTPINLVDLTLDTVFEGLSGHARVLDPACGSGVFLVEAMRRLVWKRSQSEPCTRCMVRDVLYNQITGVDINAGALQVTAFSLYLAALELDPELQQHDLEWLRFDRLIGRTLHHASFFETPQLGGKRFDVIVGNPPWTYDARATGGAHGAPIHARVAQPRRTPDWAFLWHARELAAPGARIALLMKATPFFSKDPAANEARSVLLNSFQSVSLLNLSPLRVEDLFPSVPETESGKRGKPTKGAALLFSGTVGSARSGEQIVFGNALWSENYRRNGVLDIAPELFKRVAVERVRSNPSLFKAAMLGNAREFGVMETLGRSPTLLRMGMWCDIHGLSFEQGLQLRGGGHGDCFEFVGLPFLSASDYIPGRVPQDLPAFSATHAHRPRERKIYRAPLVLCPEASFSKALQHGRYSAAVSLSDIVYTDSFVGVSFAGEDPRFAVLLCCILNSKVVAFQLAFGGSNLGIKQPKVEKIDLESLLLPELFSITEDVLQEVTKLEAHLVNSAPSAAAIRYLDEFVMDLYDLSSADRRVIDDVLSRSRPIFMDSRQSRLRTTEPVDEKQLLRYGGELSHWLDTALNEVGHFRTVLNSAVRLTQDLVAVRLDLADGPLGPLGPFRIRQPELFESALLEVLGSETLRAFQGKRFLGLYVDRSIYVVKPDERRFWQISDAQGDFEAILRDRQSELQQLGALDAAATSDSIRDCWQHSRVDSMGTLESGSRFSVYVAE